MCVCDEGRERGRRHEGSSALPRPTTPHTRPPPSRPNPPNHFPLQDTICTKKLRTTAASALLANHVPAYDAEAVSRLRAAGAVVLGKTNCDQFAMGSTTESSAFQASERRGWRVGGTGGRTPQGPDAFRFLCAPTPAPAFTKAV